MRWLLNLLLVAVTLVVFLAAILFLLGNAQPTGVELLLTDWQPVAPLGQWLLGFLLAGLLLGLIAGAILATGWRRRYPRT
ncbi:hypothetical protein [Isoalcanivorax indicus]|uniref:hypothetical protein n=1 Tax=Isoalcanivorax indicus TaxID=2202653 RepID=UPI000DB91443|nr:hypothetical protein [Isoalcanivorax indicus]